MSGGCLKRVSDSEIPPTVGMAHEVSLLRGFAGSPWARKN